MHILLHYFEKSLFSCLRTFCEILGIISQALIQALQLRHWHLWSTQVRILSRCWVEGRRYQLKSYFWLDYYFWVWVPWAFFCRSVEDGKLITATLNPWFERENCWILPFIDLFRLFKVLIAGWWVRISERKRLNRNASLSKCTIAGLNCRVFTLICCKVIIIIAAVSNQTWRQIKCCVDTQDIIRIAAHFYYIIQLNSRSKENVIAITYTRNSFYKF